MVSCKDAELAAMILRDQLAGHDDETARNMVRLAEYISNRGHRIPVVSAGVNGKACGVIFDGAYHVEGHA